MNGVMNVNEGISPMRVDWNYILDLPVDHDVALTIRGYLHRLMSALWRDRHGFSGKRPFGDSGWEFTLYESLVENGIVKGEFDEDMCLKSVDVENADKVIQSCINFVFGVE